MHQVVLFHEFGQTRRDVIEQLKGIYSGDLHRDPRQRPTYYRFPSPLHLFVWHSEYLRLHLRLSSLESNEQDAEVGASLNSTSPHLNTSDP